MTKLNYLFGGFLLSFSLLLSSCGGDTAKEVNKNSPEYNLLASVDNPAALFSIDIMDLLKKSDLKETKDMPVQFKMIVNSQIDQHFNSENQGFKLEGNIPFIVSTTNEHEFDFIMSFFDVLDVEKVGPSLCMYFNGKVEKVEGVSILEAKIPGFPFKGHFAWDDKKLVFIGTEKSDSKSLALVMLSNRFKDAPENKEITNFLSQNNDFSSLLFMDNYTKMVNKLSQTSMDKELEAAYEGLTVKGIGNFNEGNFTFETDLEGEEFINSRFNNISTSTIDKSFYDYITDNNQLIAYGVSSLNINAIVAAMDQTKSKYNQYEKELAKIGVKKEDISLVFDGQVSASLMDIESIPTEGYEGNVAFNQDRPKVLVTCGLKDADKLSTLMTGIPNVKPINNYFITDDIYMGINESKLFISLNEELIKKLVAGEKLANYSPSVSINKPLHFSIVTDMNKLPINYKNSLLRNNGEEVLKFYNQLEGIQFNGDINHTEFKVDFTEKSKNSFEVISNSVLKNILPLLMTSL
jgi:hypothetical protein